MNFLAVYDWWCEACERGVHDSEELEVDEEDYLLCPHCEHNRLIGFDEKDEYL